MLSSMDILDLGLDCAPLSPPESSFYCEDILLQHCSELRPQTPLQSDDYLIQGYEDIRNLLGVNELDLYNEPELSLVAMDKEVTTQLSKDSVVLEYGFESSALLSPVSIEPSSPAQVDGISSEEQLELIPTNEDYLDSILEMFSVDSNDSQSEEQCYDSDLSVQVFIETEVESGVREEPKMIGSVNALTERPKRQLKRKVSETEEQLPKRKANKRTKKTLTEKRERKRSQNKDAANRYRLKKRKELESQDDQQKRFEDCNSNLRSQLDKLQMEFKVVYSLAKAAFAIDWQKNLQLQALDLRVVKENLLD